MLRVKMKKVEPISSEKQEPEVHIQVTLNTPQVGAEPFLGIFFKNAPEIVISETSLSFSQMKKVMAQHKLKNWDQVKNYIEDKYTEYYLQMFQDWNVEIASSNKNASTPAEKQA